jgi:hypothetical protein
MEMPKNIKDFLRIRLRFAPHEIKKNWWGIHAHSVGDVAQSLGYRLTSRLEGVFRYRKTEG